MPTRKNERITENLVRRALSRLGYDSDASNSLVEEQRSSIVAVQRLLRVASKSGRGGGGAPEFILSNKSDPDFLVIIECKAAPKDQSSRVIERLLAGENLDESPSDYQRRSQRFAVDGALHYAKALSKEFNVVAVGASGENRGSFTVESFLHPKGASAPRRLVSRHGAKIEGLLKWGEYVEQATFDPEIQRLRNSELMEFARELHDFMRDHAKLTESEKPLLVSGTLLALRNRPFATSFNEYRPAELQAEWLSVIRKEIESAEIPRAKKALMVQPYSTIAVHPQLGRATTAYPKGVLNELVARLHQKVWPFISIYHDFDVVGQFYGEFLKYTGGDKKALGIVLTPRHITELAALLANVTKKSRCLDICAGTGGFLISAMHQMMKGATTERERAAIRREGLIGVEELPNMYALAASNMILRGDGKANLYQGSCFDPRTAREIREREADVGLLNPPFSQRDSDLHELAFVKQMLDCLAPGGTGVAIVPMSCAIVPHQLKSDILRSHTLEAVMSMPEELFYPVGTITCLMVFTAHRPHEQSDRKSWFGYWRNDGFVKTKHRGRVDVNETWPMIRDCWVGSFRNREIRHQESVLARVGAQDEWCAEAYLETDYSSLTKADFERVVRDYAVFRLLTEASRDGGDHGYAVD